MPNIKKRFLITGCVLLAVASLLILYVILIGTGVISGREQRLVIRAGTAEKLYDGRELVCEEWELTYGQLKSGHTIVPVFSGSRSIPGQTANRVTVRILDANGADVTDEYSIEYVDGVLSVYSQKLTVTALDAQKPYDGTPLTPDAEGWLLTYGATMMNHRLRVSLAGSITDAGSCPVTVTAKVLDENGQDITQYYEIDCVPATLTVMPREITLTTADVSKVYDGLPIEQGSAELLGELVAGHNLKVTFPESFSEVGRTQNVFSAEITDAAGADIVRNYHITTQMGTLEILPRELVVESATAKKIYDGSILTAPTYQILQGSVLDEHNLTVNVTGSQTELGFSQNLFTVDIHDGNGVSVMHNYTVYTMPGLLSVVETLDNKPVEDPTPEGPITFHTDFVGPVYLREISFGDLVGAAWSEGTPYREEGLQLNPLFLTAQALLHNGYEPYSVYVTDYNEWCLFPSYTTQVDGLELYTDDVSRVRFATEYYAYAIAYDYLTEGVYSLPDEYVGLERVYANFVREHYLTVPEELRWMLQNFVDAYGLYWDASPDGLRRVLDAMREAYTVNDQPDLYPTDVNPVEFLMSQSYEGNDYHFASTATLLYRFMGIPARLVRGYAVESYGSDWYTVACEDTSYWVEVYVDGMGWIMLDPLSYEQSSAVDSDDDLIPPEPGSGNVMGGGRPDMDAQVLQLYSPVSGRVYLRLQSYGPYVDHAWGSSPTFDSQIAPDLPLYWIGQVLENQGIGATPLQIKWLVDSAGYLVPYYVNSGLDGVKDESFIADPTREYTIYYYDYDILQTLTGLSSALIRYNEDDEAYMAYRDYVYANFLDIPDPELQETVFNHLVAAKINPESDTLISDVARYVQNVAEYDYDFPNPTDGTDPIVYFLDVSRRGVCRHYASAAVMMYRALGIPARYVTGFLGTTEANTETFVTADKAHAWAEVFIDGLGWVPVEVTGSIGAAGGGPGSNPGSGSGGGSGDQPSDGRPEKLMDLHVKPVDVVVEFDGNPHYATEYKMIGQLLDGHVLTCYFEGELVYPGQIDSYISGWDITDQTTGANVTDWYRVHTGTGIIEVLERDMEGMERPIIVIKPVDVVATYNGRPHSATQWEYNEDSIYISPNHDIVCSFGGELTEPGVEKSIITECRIYDRSTGQDVTDQYRLRVLPGIITVLEADLYVAVKPVDAIFDYDGLTHNATDWEMLEGSFLLPGHSLVCDVLGSRIVPGAIATKIDNIRILDEITGADVTHLYETAAFSGTLTVLPRSLSVKPVDVEGICDGTLYTASAWEYCVGSLSLLEGHQMTCIYEGSRKTPGVSESRILEYKVLDIRTGEDVSDYYSLVGTEGSITVRPREDVITLEIKPKNVMELYTGKAYSPTDWEFTKDNTGSLLSGHKLVCTYTGSLTYPIIADDPANASVQSAISSYRVVDTATGEDVTYLYNIFTQPGTITVKELRFTITPKDIIMPFDGKLHVATEYSCKELTSLYGDTKWLNNYDLIVQLKGSRSSYGKGTITVESVQVLDKNTGEDVTRAFVWTNGRNENYVANVGTIQIYADKLAFATDNATKTYDGSPLSTTVSLIGGNLLAGHTLDLTPASITNAGELDNIPDWKVRNARGEDVTDWYIMDRQASSIGKLKVKARELTVRARDAQAVYSPGFTLTCNEFDIVSGSIAPGDWLEVTITGAQSTVGYSENTISSVKVHCVSDEKGSAANYIIKTELGILTLLPPH